MLRRSATDDKLLIRWYSYINQFKYSVAHIPTDMNPADYLSRYIDSNISAECKS